MVMDGHSNILVICNNQFNFTNNKNAQHYDKKIRNEANINNKIPHLNGIIKIIQRELTELYLQNKLRNIIQSEKLNQNNCYRTIQQTGIQFLTFLVPTCKGLEEYIYCGQFLAIIINTPTFETFPTHHVRFKTYSYALG